MSQAAHDNELCIASYQPGQPHQRRRNVKVHLRDSPDILPNSQSADRSISELNTETETALRSTAALSHTISAVEQGKSTKGKTGRKQKGFRVRTMAVVEGRSKRFTHELYSTIDDTVASWCNDRVGSSEITISASF